VECSAALAAQNRCANLERGRAVPIECSPVLAMLGRCANREFARPTRRSKARSQSR
jgi:hypothetical protein